MPAMIARLYQRVPFFCKAKLTVWPSKEPVDAFSFDISLGGAGLNAPISCPRGNPVRVSFFLSSPEGEHVEQVSGRVAYIRADETHTRVGVEFNEPLLELTFPELTHRLEKIDASLGGEKEREQTMAFEDWCIKRARVSSKPHKAVSLDDKMTFFQQLSTLICSGTPMLQAIQICAEQSQSLKLRVVLASIADRVSSGSSLNGAAAAYPHVFQNNWIEVIRTGEITGQMGPVLLELNKQIRETRETHRKVSGALMYPIILIVVAVVAITVMLWLVVPVFAKMFKDMGAELPGMTQFVVNASDFIVHYGIYVVGGIIAVGVAIRQYMKTESGRRRVGSMGLAMPLFGDLIVQSAMYRFATNSALLLKSGIPMLETLTVLENIFRTSPIYRDAFARARSRVSAGRPLATSLEETGLFTTLMTNMVRIGEQSGQLALVVEQIAPYYKEQMESLIARVTKLMEPIIIVGMGVTVAGLMMSIYMPMFEMAGKVH